MTVWLIEIWHAWRASLRRPGFLLLATGVLALGIGASVAVFTLIDQVLMKPLPLPDASRVMVVGMVHGSELFDVSPRQYQHMGSLDGVTSTGVARGGEVNIAGGGPPEIVRATYMDHTLLPTLGLQPVLGHNFTAREDRPHGPQVVMLGYQFWQHRYGGRRDVLGKTLDVKGSPYTVVGVLPRRFGALRFSGDVALPLALPSRTTASDHSYVVVARLRQGAGQGAVTAQVNARMQAMYAAMPASQLATFGLQQKFAMRPITAWQHHAAHGKLTLFMACALFVLLTALVNLVNLMLLRSLSGAHDGAVRSALGASSMRLALPALAEGLLVGVLGALVGTACASAGLHMLAGMVSADWLPAAGVHPVPWVWALALGVSVVCAVLAAAFGVWRSRVTATLEELRAGGRSGVGRRGSRVGQLLVIAQVMLATVLLSGSGLLLHGLYKAAGTPLGFSSRHMLAFNLTPLAADYPDGGSVKALARRLVRRLEAIPGVTAATVTSNLPTGAGQNLVARKQGGSMFSTQFRSVGADFFKLFDIPLLHGRLYSGDAEGGVAVAVVNRAFADHVLGGHALGKVIDYGSLKRMWPVRIVGVVGNTRQGGPLQPAPAILYVPLAQVPNRLMRMLGPSSLIFVLHGHGNIHQWRAGVRAAMADVAPRQPVSDFRTMDQVVQSTTAATRRTLLLIGTFAALALLLAAAGLYAVMAVMVAAREREFGVRMALGAAPLRLVRLVLRGGLVQIGTGLAVGVAIVIAVSHPLQQLLVELVARHNTFDPVALVGVCVVLAIAGMLACLLPAVRAARVQPMHALRRE